MTNLWLFFYINTICSLQLLETLWEKKTFNFSTLPQISRSNIFTSNIFKPDNYNFTVRYMGSNFQVVNVYVFQVWKFNKILPPKFLILITPVPHTTNLKLTGHPITISERSVCTMRYQFITCTKQSTIGLFFQTSASQS